MPRLGLLMIQPILIAILIKVVASDDVFDIYEPTQQILFTFSCSGIWIGIFNTIQEVCKERAIVKREYMSNLRLTTYILSKYAIQLLISLAQTFIFVGYLACLWGNLPSSGVKTSCFCGSIYYDVAYHLFFFCIGTSRIFHYEKRRQSDGSQSVPVNYPASFLPGILFPLKGASRDYFLLYGQQDGP